MTPPLRVYPVRALVLRRHNLGETDRIVRLFTHEHGKVDAIAKGARGPRSRLSGATEPFVRLSAQLAKGQNLEVLTQAVVEDSYPELRKDLTRVGYASYFLEVVDVGLEDRQEAPGLWDLLAEALRLLEQATAPELLARAFEWRALVEFGYEPRLDECVVDGAPVQGAGVVFHPQRGGMLCPRCAASQRGGIRLLPDSVQALQELPGLPMAAAARASLPPAVARQVTACLVGSIRQHLGADLRTLRFLDEVQPK